jgi:hypothetical protein
LRQLFLPDPEAGAVARDPQAMTSPRGCHQILNRFYKVIER